MEEEVDASGVVRRAGNRELGKRGIGNRKTAERGVNSA